jgi:hypothetical protein
MLFEEPAPACRVGSGVQAHKREHLSANKNVRFGEQALEILRVRQQ